MAAQSAQMPSSNGKLEHMELLGRTVDDTMYQWHQNAFVKVPSPQWRVNPNGNPASMVDIVRGALPDHKVLFIVQRDMNCNIAVYCAQVSSAGQLDADAPVSVFWLMVPTPLQETEDGVDVSSVYTESLNAMEQSLAYGISSVTPLGGKRCHICIRAVNNEPIEVCLDDNDEWAAYVTIRNERLKLHEFMIYTEPRRWAPWPKSVQLHVTASSQQHDYCYHYAI